MTSAEVAALTGSEDYSAQPAQNPQSSQSFSEAVLNWYQQHGRKNLPWQRGITPYRVWVSEIMLQQTQVTTVIPYFERFMDRFPTLESLATATQDEVLHLWTGLGYYARGRNLHACAKRLVEQHAGQFPTNVEQLSDLPGIGRSTAGAIVSISMGLRAPILDGNVKRVLTRYFAIEGWPGSTQVQKRLWLLADQLTPSDKHSTSELDHRHYTQAMMDLGATLCTRSKPSCGICPLLPGCKGYETGNPTDFPHSKPKKVKPEKNTCMLILENNQGEYLLEQRPTVGIWGGLWSFPEFDTASAAVDWIYQHTREQDIDEGQLIQLASFRHTFSHYHLDIQPLSFRLTRTLAAIGERKSHWYNPANPSELGLAAPVKKLLNREMEQASPLT